MPVPQHWRQRAEIKGFLGLAGQLASLIIEFLVPGEILAQKVRGEGIEEDISTMASDLHMHVCAHPVLPPPKLNGCPASFLLSSSSSSVAEAEHSRILLSPHHSLLPRLCVWRHELIEDQPSLLLK